MIPHPLGGFFVPLLLFLISMFDLLKFTKHLPYANIGAELLKI